jgi:hypothetical protein
MKYLVRYGVGSLLALAAARPVLADEPRSNPGNDPFFQISSAIAHCPPPLGPQQTAQEWLSDAHYRIERGISCWVEGRCRLSNSYRYDTEIAVTVRRRLQTISQATHWQEKSTLWLMLQRRFIYVQGCVAPDFDKAKFLSELAGTADVEKVIDNITTNPQAESLPYKTLADPLKRPVQGGD